MEEYIIVNSNVEYFVEINKVNKMVFTNNKEEATKVSYADAEELISLIEFNGYVVEAERL